MTEVTSGVVRLDDLAHPRFSDEAQAIRELMAAVAPDCPLDSDRLHAKAIEDTGLRDFGASDYRQRLEVYLSSIREIDGLDAAGTVNFHAQLLQWLKNRLLLTDLLSRHPEIHDIELVPPVVIAGLPRSGTTHLHNLLAATPTFRTLPYWESNEPVPLASETGPEVEVDPRVTRMHNTTAVMDVLMPHFALMHEMTTDHVHEEIQLLANDFSTMLFETLGDVPRWRDYYLSHDQGSAYEYLATQLKVLQFLRGGRRWLLKSPQHLEQLPTLQRVFPGVIVVCTHRDPVPVVLSMVAMLTYSARMHRYPVPVHDIAASWVNRLQLMLDTLVRERDVIGPGHSVDIRFDEFMSDEMSVAQRVYDIAGEDLSGDCHTAIGRYLDEHRRGRLGRVETSCEMFGLDEQDLRDRFAGYTQRFL
ncbi:sulfotransferase family protein [Mycolicibacterium mengxianglii]|uniref:sulfotransferase family protein n=1 Tax=Mycolicibacterium mengxianglii TaxID=2736649 RepID=UPI0018CFF5D3|nr:sulfotransferase [Mycolicibacterium mengxianglii]